jgi:hypothetical protein
MAKFRKPAMRFRANQTPKPPPKKKEEKSKKKEK